MNLQRGILDVLTQLGKRLPENEKESLISTGILDSLSILELVDALEGQFDIFFEEDDLSLENFDNLAVIERLIKARLGNQNA